METKELIEQLRSCGTRNCPECPEVESCTGPSVIMRKAAECLDKLVVKYDAALEMAATATEIAAQTKKVDGDLIRRSDVLKYPLRRDTCDKKNANPHFINGVESVMEYVEALTAVEADPVVHAHWEPTEILGMCKCSKCGFPDIHNEFRKQCSSCGAHMDEEVADE